MYPILKPKRGGKMYNIYIWDNLKEDSPQAQTRNQWLYNYGAFARYNGLWFPCKVINYTTIGEPAQVMPIRIATMNQDIYPMGLIMVSDLEVLYTVFNNGQSIENYISQALGRKDLTTKMLDSALRRSINTEIITAPKRLIQQIKMAMNSLARGEIRVVDTSNIDDIQVIDLPKTADVLEKLWNSNDWAMQEVSQLLGLSFNPADGKKERMVKSELLGDRDLTIMNRDMITSRLYKSAKEFNETVEHISNYIDTLDRGLTYQGGTVKEKDKGVKDDGGIQDDSI